MSAGIQQSGPESGRSPRGQVMVHELEALQSQWWCFAALGAAMVLLGLTAIGYSVFASIVAVALFGVLLLVAGIVQVVSSFWAGKWSGMLVHILVGLLYVVTGYLLLDTPVASAIALTLVIAAFLVVAGLFRIVAAMTLHFHDWGWVLLNGIVTLVLGLLIYKQWPASGLWVIGLFVGIEMVFNGVAWIMLSQGLRRFPAVRG
ncbi:MAG: HdeD family acid-resistance protein [Pirellulales bacterium]